MKLLASLKKLVFGENIPLIEALAPTPVGKYHEMVGEPVISFLDSLKREPKRYKLEKVLKIDTALFPAFTCYHWMHGAGFYRLTDRKSGLIWEAYVHESGSVYRVMGLPFSLNGWELRAIFGAFAGFRQEARIRKERLSSWRADKAYHIQRQRELAEREGYAKHFQSL